MGLLNGKEWDERLVLVAILLAVALPFAALEAICEGLGQWALLLSTLSLGWVVLTNQYDPIRFQLWVFSLRGVVNADARYVRACLMELNRIKYETLDLNFQEVEKKVLHELSDIGKTKHAIEVEKLSPRDVVWIVIKNAVEDILSRGNCHIYRGVLNFTGTQLYALWKRALLELERSGANTPTKNNEERAWMQEQIKSTG